MTEFAQQIMFWLPASLCVRLQALPPAQRNELVTKLLSNHIDPATKNKDSKCQN